MVNLLWFGFGLLFGGGVVYLAMMQQQWTEKGRRMGRIWNIIERTGSITHAQAARVAEVSDTTADRYLEEFERGGHIKQIGRTGKYVYYKRK